LSPLQTPAHEDHGIFVVDTGFPAAYSDAAYLVVEQGRAAFVDTGTHTAVPRLLDALAQRGLTPDCVDWVILTHVHLDHAGGAGLLMQSLPKAQLVVHPRGKRHMIDPTQLLAGVRAVYGEEVTARDYGTLVPVPAERIVDVVDGSVVMLAGRRLQLFDTPGHARHHLCVWDEVSRGWFTGDTLGVAYPEFHSTQGHYGLPTTSPAQFDPPALKASVHRMLGFEPAYAYLTHFGVIDRVAEQARMVLGQIDRMVELADRFERTPDRTAVLGVALTQLYAAEARAAGVTLDNAAIEARLALDTLLNVQGLEVWLDSRKVGA
jgi:glyoxylase-like metal-dependent hydrolase (beta-lactamase superfamily II)